MVSSEVWSGMYSRGITDAVSQHIRADLVKSEGKGCDFIDVGANLGWFSMLAASLGCRVIAVEPQAKVCNLVRTSIAMNGFQDRVTLLEGGVSDDPNLKLAVVDGGHNWGNGQVRKSTDNSGVTAYALAAYLTPGKYYTVMKLDCQGCEEAAVRGAGTALTPASVGMIVLEYNGVSEMGGSHTVAELILARGYKTIVSLKDNVEYNQETFRAKARTITHGHEDFAFLP
jgi:FkbM family methyltransferase